LSFSNVTEKTEGRFSRLFFNAAIFAGKKYATIFNGSRDDAKSVTDFADNIFSYFKLVKAGEGINYLGNEADNALDSCRQRASN